MGRDWNGYMGKILNIDLKSKKIAEEDLDRDLCERFLGGRGFGAKILYDRLAPETDPFSPDNLFILATGPLTGTSVPGSKLEIISKSPSTKGYADCAVGGHIGPEVKYAGYDVIVIKGKSSKPTCLWIDNDHLEFRDASHLWGKGCFATEEHIQGELGKDAQVLSIGPAGEKLVKIACITHASGRQAGRCGMGAVMGSKNLKAIAVRGDLGVRLANPEAFQEKILQLREHVLGSEAAMNFHEFGTTGGTLEHNQVGCLPTRNFQSGFFDQTQAFSGQTLHSTAFLRHGACFGCTLACAKWTRARGVTLDGPEYETVAMLGSDCGIANLGAIIKANYICDDLGIDTISAGNIIAFAMECYEKGIISNKETGGMALRFGDEEGFFKLISMIADREGIGDTLAEGVRAAARRFGKGSEKFAFHSKGLEQSGYETRAALGQVLGYSVNDRGADHNRIWDWSFFGGEKVNEIAGKAEAVKKNQCRRSASDIMGVCRFVTYFIDIDDYGRLIEYATGAKTTGTDILRFSERVFNLTRLFNTREGFTREDDHVPSRIFEEPVPDGPKKGAVIKKADYEKVLDEFYKVSGWDKAGVPTEAKLMELDLKDIARDFRAFAHK